MKNNKMKNTINNPLPSNNRQENKFINYTKTMLNTNPHKISLNDFIKEITKPQIGCICQKYFEHDIVKPYFDIDYKSIKPENNATKNYIFNLVIKVLLKEFNITPYDIFFE